jgi:hypothetical protein
MKILNLILALVISASAAIAQNTEPYLVKSFSGEAVTRIEASTSGGMIKVNGGASTPKVTVYIRSNSLNQKLSKKEIEERLENYILEVKMSGSTLVCIAKSKKENFSWNNSNRLSIGFEIDTPERVDTDLATSGGSITLSRLNGNLNFRTSGGSLQLAALRGTLKGSTSGGSIKAEKLDGTGSLTTSGGSINVENTSGEFRFSTSGGSITFNNLKGEFKGVTSGGSIRANNVSGDLAVSTNGGSIKFTNIEGNLNGSTSGGGIEGNILTIKDHVSLSTSAGSIKVDLPFNEGLDLDLKGNRVYSDKLAKVSNTLKEGRVNGKINGGGKSVKMRTSAGSIYVD